MQTYDAFSRAPYPNQIPPMRTPHDPVAGSGTPIYDALYSEYRRLFRALPGDRTGEEELRFEAFQPWQPMQDPEHDPRNSAYGRPYTGRQRGGGAFAALPPAPPRDNRTHGGR
ncbi:hypothetical protein NGB36_32055 [Streptomyces sp. RB6PN25]|uniref:Uncharacterized protein n=1 Tax=Streptomyces humicola TaxID=2953240 RepID=A0ABT1Q5A8_9ACTN|nr:hypothetical protein [Streptomyces humicola]MCQ4085074.1 hypothetical protein [Streptomyces humicola]